MEIYVFKQDNSNYLNDICYKQKKTKKQKQKKIYK